MPSSPDLSFLRRPASLKRIAAIAMGCALVGALYAFLAPKWYRSTLAVVPARAQRQAFGGLVASELGGLAAGLDTSLAGSADATRIAAVLQSISVTDAVVEKFDLRARYGEKHQEHARDELWRHCDVKTMLKPNLVQISCEDRDAAFVQSMLTYFAEVGNRVFRRIGVSSATEEVLFLEKRVAELRQQAEETAARMREFQEKHHIVDLDTQAKAVVSALAGLNTQSIAKEVELEYARTFSSRDEATTRQLRSQIAVLAEKLRDLQEPQEDAGLLPEKRSRPHRDASRGMFPSALSVPKLRAEFEALHRERKVAEATLVFALERLEAARASEARDVSTFQVLDAPTLPTRHSRPRRFTALLGATALGLILGVALEWRRASAGARGGSRASTGGPPRPAAPSERGTPSTAA